MDLTLDQITLLKGINQIYPVSAALKQDLSKFISIEKVRRKTHLLKEGQIFKRMYFIENGIARAYYYEEDKEITSWFMKEGDFIISVHSFYKQMPSRENIEVLEEAVLASISYQDLHSLYLKHLEFNIIGRVLTEHYYSLSEERLFAMRQMTAKQRFDFFIENYPGIITRVPLKQVASFLRMTPETLSRLRGL